jgi:hypothetical protein
VYPLRGGADEDADDGSHDDGDGDGEADDDEEGDGSDSEEEDDDEASGEEGEEGEEPAAVAAVGDGRRPRRHMAKDDFRKEEDSRRKRATECRDKSHCGRMHRGLNLTFVVFAVALVFSGITRSAMAVFNLNTNQHGTPGQKAHQRVMRTVRVAAFMSFPVSK